MVRSALIALCLGNGAFAQLWPSVCPQDTTGGTRCPATQTCMGTQFSLTGAGCCPWPDAVACTQGTTQCCPAGTTCKLVGGSGYGAIFNCTDSATGDFVTENAAICKPGALTSYSTTLKNVLVIGDSLSIGYTPYLCKDGETRSRTTRPPFALVQNLQPLHFRARLSCSTRPLT